MLQKLPVFILLALTTLLGACTSSTKPSGHLVIVGGGLEDDNAAVFTRFVELCADGPIGIVPTASGDGLEAGEHSAARWRKWAGTREVVVIPLTQFDAAKASDPAIIAQIDSCGGLWFTGGDQSRIVAVFRPEGKDTPAMQAVRRVLDKGGVVGGTSAGAAMMSDPMITGGRSRSGKSTDPENQDDRRVRTGPGLGLFTLGLTDQHFLERGRMGRLIDAMQDTGVTTGVGISENSALVVPVGTQELWETIGPRSICLIDASEPGAFVGETATVRLSVLDTFKVTDALGEMIFAATVQRLGATSESVHQSRIFKPIERDGFIAIISDVDNVWAHTQMTRVFDEFSRGKRGTIELRDRTTELTITADDHTHVVDVKGSILINDLLVEVRPR